MKSRHFAICLLLLLLLLGSQSLPGAIAETPLAVTLIYFTGESGNNAAFLEWRTATELDLAAFKLERADSASGPYIFLEEIGLIPGRGSAASGDIYEATDETAVNGETYWYRLIEIEVNNTEHTLDVLSLTISPEPTPPPVSGGGGGSTSTPFPTSTRAPTNTPRPEATSSGANATPTQGVGDPTATNTRPATNTPVPATGTNATAQTSVTATPAGGSEPLVATVTSGADAPTTASGTTIIAQVTVEGESYPGPGTAEATSGDGNSPAGADGETSSSATINGEGAADVGSIGEGGSAQATDADAEDEPAAAGGRILLWAGFLAALLVFGGGVLFAVLYSRNRRPAS